ncbi:uncharacterized protein LACBIDRAFT_319074 [Laccaria bicolor S238N-H82]|uniref:Predicted protein n=1 Tax=Laccaria bicolor (strain S238N-H82 / ATCC MYA-4686) TaxID=486041 RepID=B0D7T5_LACBS|nr:uncharacterized protein LACBIDRAFT_319074 [Laccaria bicolor S238N-H82]EDR09458.1 predicted protein [Laccaria bicolor S238N-H82]|eukprot:XP_001879807.1 predicted protein [Laccaria bicolor S238N-H82]
MDPCSVPLCNVVTPVDNGKLDFDELWLNFTIDFQPIVMPSSSDLRSFKEALASSKNILILSGAGLSAASGIPTYRSADESLWNNFDPTAYATPQAFAKDPSGVWRWYHNRRKEYLKAKPNNAHRALATLALPSALSRIAPCSMSQPLHITQNVDSLSLRLLESLSPEAAEGLIEMHGSIFVTKCTSCQKVMRSYAPSLASALDGDEDSNAKRDVPLCQLPKCGGDSWAGSNRYGNCGGLLRPEVVWFGEMPPLMGEVSRKMSQCDLLLVVGTSSTVLPASSFATQVKANGGKVAVFNLNRSTGDDEADFLFLGPCETTLVDALGVEDDIKDM